MLAEGRSTAEVLVLRHFFFYILATLNCNFTKEPYLKCDRHTGAICMETVCQVCPGKAVLLKTSWKNATVGVFSWVSGLKNGQLRRCKESASTRLSRPGYLPGFIYILHPALQLTALFSLFGPRS